MVFDKFFDTVGGFINKGGLQTVNGIVNTFAPIIQKSSAQSAAFPQGTASNVTPPKSSYAGSLAFGGTGTVSVGGTKTSAWDWVKKNWYWVVIPVVLIVGIVYLFKKRKRK